MEEPKEENIHQDDSTNEQSGSEKKQIFSESEQEPKEPAEKVPRVANSSEDDQLECGICNEVITTQVVGQPENCQHKFCLSCLIESSKRETKCPLDHQTFTKIILPNAGKSNVEDFVDIYDADSGSEDSFEELGCDFCDDEDTNEVLYRCYACGIEFHLHCLDPPVTEVPLLDDGWSGCMECSLRVCCVCGGSPVRGGAIRYCFRCSKSFHAGCHENPLARLCPSCCLPRPAAQNQQNQEEV